MRYNPLVEPDYEGWLGADEMERIRAVRAYHKRAGVKIPSLQAHAAIHVTVENQIALGDETPVAETVERLMAEGLDRHDALHAVGSVLAGHIWHMMKDPGPQPLDPNEAYYHELRELTVQKWYDEYGEPDD
jgi:hypothetical protein